MIKHILKIIQTQRRSNVWIFAELVIVAAALWFMVDKMYVDMRTWYSPLGYDIENTWRFKLSQLTPASPLFVVDEEQRDAENLLQLMERIRIHPQVEEVCATYFSCPYSFGNSWSGIWAANSTDSTHRSAFQVRRVTPEYFDVFRVRDSQGRRINATDAVRGVARPVVISQDMAAMLFPNNRADGEDVKTFAYEATVTAVSSAMRANETNRAEPCFFEVMHSANLVETVNMFGAEYAELCVRMKSSHSQDEMYALLEEMGDRLTVNNLSVYGLTPISWYRNIQLSGSIERSQREIALMLFLLVNVLFGITGTFWMRTRSRRAEVGIRMAMGASKSWIRRFLYGEGLSLLALTLPLTALFAVNLIGLGVPDVARMPINAARISFGFGVAYAILAAMILAGVWFPARKSTAMEPSDALRYE